MKNIKVSVVESISEELEQIQNRIRERAYEKFLEGGHESNRELEDWLSAERELLSILTATITEEEQQICAQIEMPEIDPQDLRIQVTTQDVLIHAGTPKQSGHADSNANTFRLPFGVIRFSAEVDPAGVRAEYGLGMLRLTAPISQTAKSFKKSA